MPIRIDDNIGGDVLDVLCEGEWTMSPQVGALERWLTEKADTLPPGEYVADIGIRGVDPEARGGGSVLTLDMMKTMVRLGMEIWISEYGGGRREEE